MMRNDDVAHLRMLPDLWFASRQRQVSSICVRRKARIRDDRVDKYFLHVVSNSVFAGC